MPRMNRPLFPVAHTLHLTSLTTIASAQRFHHLHRTQPHHWHHHSSAAKSLKSSQNTLALRSASVKFVRHCKSYVHQSFFTTAFFPPLFRGSAIMDSWRWTDLLFITLLPCFVENIGRVQRDPQPPENQLQV